MYLLFISLFLTFQRPTSHLREEEDHQKSRREEPEGRREKKGHPEEEGKDTEGPLHRQEKPHPKAVRPRERRKEEGHWHRG